MAALRVALLLCAMSTTIAGLQIEWLPHNATALVGGKHTFRCDVSGTPKPTVTWEHLTQAMEPPSAGQRVLRGSKLRLTNLRLSDKGYYRCLAENREGIIRSNYIFLDVQDPLHASGAESTLQCAKFCPGNTKFGYEAGKTYEYAYTSVVRTHLPLTTPNTTEHQHPQEELRYGATAHIHVISRCEMSLRLSDVTLGGSRPSDVIPGAAQFRDALTRSALRFAFVDGYVEGVCPPVGGEEPWVVNVKRAILSNLQNVMNDFRTDIRTHETDVSGECPVRYEVMAGQVQGKMTVIRKTHTLERCTGRQDIHTILHGTPFTNSRSQAASLLKGTHVCTQLISQHGVLTGSTCRETHTLRPFSDGDSGATTDVKTSLLLRTVRGNMETDQGPIGEPLPLLYDHTPTREHSPRTPSKLPQLLRMCHQTPPEAATFRDLVRRLREMDAGVLRQLYFAAKQGDYCQMAMRQLHDAIPLVGTAASVRLIKDLVITSEVTGGTLTTWMVSLGLTQDTTTLMLSEVTPLLLDPYVGPQAALAVSSMVAGYCARRSECGRVPEVRHIVDALRGMLGADCSEEAVPSPGGYNRTTSGSSKVMLALRALGNTGYAGAAARILGRCMHNVQLGMGVRVAAVQAFRRMGCTDELSGLMRLFEDQEADSELRINAYLALMSSCPSTDLLQRVKARLQGEETNQVGSFIWTHLTNLQESSSPLKHHLRQLLGSESLRAKFDLDKRRFSRNIEKRFHSAHLGLGGSVESDIVWSAESFVPRSASVNLTVEVFGEAFNLLEVGGRVEGVDGMLKELFDTHNPPDKHWTNPAAPGIDHLSDGAHSKRAQKPHGSFYIRTLGREIAYGDVDQLDAESIRDTFSKLNLLNKLARGEQLDYSKSFQFIDSTLSVPTISGLPLRMQIDGNAVTALRAKCKVDVSRFFTKSKSLLLEAEFAPSADVQIVAKMAVDAHVLETGLRTVSTLHTSTAISGQMELRNGELFTVDLNMPQENSHGRRTIIKVQAQHHVHRLLWETVLEPQSHVPHYLEPVPSGCVGGRFTTVTGLDVCSSLVLPPRWGEATTPWSTLLTSPTTFSVLVTNKDKFTKYHLEAKLLTRTNGHSADHARVSFTTPGSVTDREVTLDYYLHPQEGDFQLTLRSPWKKAQMKASMVTSPSPRLLLRTVMDDAHAYSLEAALNMDTRPTPGSLHLEPRLELSTPDRDPTTITGTLTYVPAQTLSAHLDIANLLRLPVSIHADIGVAPGRSATGGELRVDTAMRVKSEWVNLGLVGFVDRIVGEGLNVHSCRMDAYYTSREQVTHRVVVSNKVRRDARTKGHTLFSFTSGLTNTMAPNYNYDLSADLSLGGHSMSVGLDAVLNSDRRRSFYFAQNVSFSSNKGGKNANFDVRIKIPLKNVDHRMRLQHKHSPTEFLSSAVLQSSASTLGDVTIHAEKMPRSRKLTGRLQYPGRQVTFTEEALEVADRDYRHAISVHLQEGETITCVTNIKGTPPMEFDMEFTSPFTNRAKMKGSLAYNRSSFTGSLTAGYGPEYALELLAKMEAGERFLISEDFGVRTPATHYSLNSSLDVQKLEAVNVGPGGLSTGISLPKIMPALKVRYGDVNGFIHYNLTGSLGKCPYTRAGVICHIESSMSLRSLGKQLQNFTLSVKAHNKEVKIFNNKFNEIETAVKLTWGVNKERSGRLVLTKNRMWTDVDAIVEYTSTPALSPLHSSARITYKDEILKIASIINDHKVNVYMNSSKTNTSGIYVNITVTDMSHHNVLANFSMKVNCKTDAVKSSMDGILSVTIANDTTTLTMHGQQEQSPMYKNTGSMKLTFTGWKPGKDIDLQWNRIHDGGYIETNATMDIGGYEHDLVYVSNKTGLKRNIDLELNIYPKSGGGLFKFIYEKTSHNANLLATWENAKDHKRKEILKGSLNFNGSEFDVDLALFTTVKLMTSNKKENNQLLSTFKIFTTDSDQDFLKLNSKVKCDGSAFEGRLAYKDSSLYSHKVNMGILKFGDKWEASMKITNNKRHGLPHINLSTKLDLGTKKKIISDIESNIEGLEKLYFEMDFMGSMSDFRARAELLHNWLADTILLDLKIDVADLDSINAKADFKSPFKWIDHIRAVYHHKVGPGYDISTSGSFKTPGFKFILRSQLSLQSWNSFSTNTELMYGLHQKVALTTSFEAGENFLGLITVETPVMIAEHLTLKVNYEGPIQDCKANVEIGLDKERTISIFIKQHHERDIHLVARITTPFRNYKSLGIDFGFLGYKDDYKQDWAFTLEEKRFAGQNEFHWIGTNMYYSSKIQTPFTRLENLFISMNYAGPLHDFKTNIIIGWGEEQNISMSTERYHERDIHFTTKISTPFRNYKVMGIDFNFVGYMDNYNQDWAFTLAEKRIVGQNSFRWKGTDIAYTSGMQTPFARFENLLFVFKHGGRIRDCKTNITIGLNKEQNISISIQRYHERDIHFTTNITTPFQNYKTMGIAFNFVGYMDNYSQDWAFMQEEKCLAGQNLFYWKGTQINYTSGMQTPFIGFEKLLFTFKHKGLLDNFKQLTTFEYPEGKSSIDIAFGYGEGNVTGSANLQLAPLLGRFMATPDNLSLTVNHSGNMQRFQNKIQLSIDDISYSSGSMLKIVGYNVDATAFLFDPTKRFSLSVAHIGQLNDFKCKYMITIFDTIVNIAHELNYAKDLRGRFEVDTTFDKLKYVLVSFSHVGLKDDFTNEAVLQINVNEYRATSKLILKSGENLDLNYNVVLFLPNEYSLTVTHKGSISNMRTIIVLKGEDSMITSNTKLIVHEMGFDASSLLSTPFMHYEDIQAVLKHSRQQDKIQAEGSFSINKRKDYDGKFILQHGANVSAALNLNTPLHSLTIKSINKGPFNDFQNTIDIRLDSEKYICESQFKYEDAHTFLKVEVKLPEEYSIMLKSKVEPSDVGVSLDIEMNGQNIHATTDLTSKAGNIDASFKVLTPFSSLGRQVFRFTHTGHINKFKTSGYLETSLPGFDNIGFNINHNGITAHFTANADLHTPFITLKTASIVINHETGRNYLKNYLTLNYNRASIISTVNFEKSGDNIEASAMVDSSFSGYEKFVFKMNKEGTLKDIHCGLTLNTPHQFLSMLQINAHHRAHNELISTGFVLDINDKHIKISTDIHVVKEFGVLASLELPFDNLEKFMLAYHHKMKDQAYHTVLRIETPFKNFESVGFKSKILLTMPKVEFGVVTHFIRPMEFNFENRLVRNGMTTSASLFHPELRITLVHSMSRTLTRIAASGSIRMSIYNLERFAYICSLDGSEEDMLHFTAKVDHPFAAFANPGIQISIKLIEDWYKDLEVMAIITTLAKEQPPINLNVMHKYNPQHMSTSAYLIYSKRKINAAFKYSTHSSSKEWNGLLEVPIEGFDRFSFRFRCNERGLIQVYSGKLETPLLRFNDPAFGIEIERSGRLLKVSGSVTTPFKWLTPITGSVNYNHDIGHISVHGNIQANEEYIQLTSTFDREGHYLKSQIDVATAVSGFENFGFTLENDYDIGMLMVNIDVVLPKAFRIISPKLHLLHYGKVIKDFNTKLSIQAPVRTIKPISLSIKHKVSKLNFDTELQGSYGTLSYLGVMQLLRSSSSVQYSTSVTTPTKDRFALDLIHIRNRVRFSSLLKVQTPYQEYADPEFELIHESFPNSCSSSIKIITPFKDISPLTVIMENRGHMGDLVTNIIAQYRGQTISLDGAFEKKGRNAKVSGALHTPFMNYEHFGFAFSHNENGMKVRTAGNIVLPFRQYVSPSFDIDYRGDLSYFTTKVTIVTPFQDIDPIVMNINFKGHLKDFQTTLHSQYQGEVISAGSVFRVSPDGILVSGRMDGSVLAGETVSISFKYQSGSNILVTQFEIDAARLLGFHKTAAGVDIHGTSSDFHMNGKVETPFLLTKAIVLHLSYKGSLKDFNAKGSMNVNDMKSEGEIQYRWKAMQIRTSHEAYAKLMTPWKVLRKSEISVSQSMTDLAWSGSVKGAYNRQIFDADYMLPFGSQKYILNVTVHHPLAMGYVIVMDPTAQSILAVLNWDKSSSVNQVRIEGSLVNLHSNTSYDYQIRVKVVHPKRKILFQIGKDETKQKSHTRMYVEFGQSYYEKWHFEMENSATSQHNSARKIMLLVFGVITTIQGESHRGSSGQRYLTKFIIKGQKTLTATTDTTTTPTGFRTMFILDHPSLTRRYQLSADGTSQPKPLLCQGKVTIEYVDTMDITWHVADVSSASGKKYVIQAAVKHPLLNTDLSCKVADSAQVFTTSVDVTHQVEEYPMRTLNVHSQLSRLDNTLNIQVITPAVDIHARRTVDRTSRHHWTMTTTTDRRTMTADVTVEESPPNLDMLLTYSPRRTLHVLARRSREDVRVEMYRMVSGERQLHLLVRHANWDDVSLQAYRQMPKLPPEGLNMSVSFDEARRVLVLQADTDPGSRTQAQIYEEAAEYARTLTVSGAAAGRRLCDDIIHEIVTPVSVVHDVLMAPVRAMARHDDYYLAYPYTIIYESGLKRLPPVLHLLSVANEKLQLTYGALYTGVIKQIPATQLHAYLKTEPKPLLELAEYARGLPAVRRAVAGADDVVRTLVTITSSSVDSVANTLRHMTDKLTSKPPRSWTAVITSKLSQVAHIDALEQRLLAIRPHLQQLAQSSLAPLHNATWHSLHLDRTSVEVWRPERGHVRLEIYRPRLALLGQELRLGILGEVVEDVGEAAEYLQVGLRTAKSIWHGSKRAMDVRHLLPPFAAHAIVGGGRHYLTFDGRLYNFTGECSYVLARDVIDDTFSIAINYAKGDDGIYIKKSLTVVHNAHRVEIHPDFRVVVDGRSVELPVTTEHTAIYRVGSTLHLDNNHGMRLACEGPYDICTVSVSGWYYGKVVGLLGSFNNEPTDDFRSKDGTRAASPEVLADGWSVGEPCQVVNHADSPVSDVNYTICAQYFQSRDSTLEPCFTEVDPAEFMTLCVRGDTCQVAAFYARACNLRGVPLPVPPSCVRCEMPGSDKIVVSQEHVTFTNNHVTKTAEVVFVVSHGTCNHDVIMRLPDMAHHLERSLKVVQVQEVRFGLVGYGGGSTEATPHAHTLEGRLTHTRAAFSKAITHFRLKAPRLPVGEDKPEVVMEDAMAALEFGASYPFLPGASKTLVLVPCGDCDITKAVYEKLRETLYMNNIRPILLTANDFRLKSKENASPKFSDVFGLDQDRVYTRRDVGETKHLGDVNLRHQTALPDNLCSTLAEKLGGAIFTSIPLTQTRNRKGFLDVFTGVVAAKSVPVTCQRCQCVAETEGSGFGRLLCRNC